MEKIYHDSKPEEIASVPNTAPHRNVDLTIEAADKAGARSVISELHLRMLALTS